MSNHLGNVMVVVSDRKVYDGNVFKADLVSTTDYYAFGMVMSDRSYNTEGYRFGFNGKENDNEVKGTGNQQDYGERIYDSRIGRFLSEDPIARMYPFYSPYQFAGNMPIYAIDLDGRESDPQIMDLSMQTGRPLLCNEALLQEVRNQYTITIMQKVHRLQGYVKKDPLEYSDVMFYYLKVEQAGQTRIFRTNYGPLTFCSDGTGPAHGSKSQQSELATGSHNADEIAYYVTGCELKDNGFSEYYSRVYVFGVNMYTCEFVESAANTLETGCNPQESTDHASNELSVKAGIPFVKNNKFDSKTFNVNSTPYERDYHDIFYAEELGTGGNSKKWAPLSGSEFELSRKFLLKGFYALSTQFKKEKPLQGIIIKEEKFDNKKVKDAIKQSKESKKKLIPVSPRKF